MTPLLSILICSIPSRWEKAKALYEHIQSMVGDKEIEIILLLDNKKRSIGLKREAAKNISRGKYFMFVDDDDSLYSVDEIYEACKQDVDVICFKSKCRNADGSEFIVTMGLQYEVEHNTEDGRYLDCNRPPFTQCAWRGAFRQIPFPDTSYGEDWGFVEQAKKVAITQVYIDKVLHGYNFDPAVSEAEVEAPKCIVNLATEEYRPMQKRLRQSIREHAEDIAIIYAEHEADIGAPSHLSDPYAFKIYAIERAKGYGHQQILWLDASVYAVKDPQPVFDWLTHHGIFMEEAGHYVGQWCNDETLKYFGITREEAMKMPMFSAGFVGFDFRRQVSKEFFEKWKQAMEDGMFKGSWKDHRHDMSVGSIIANQMGLVSKYSPGGEFFAYVGPGYSEPKGTAVFHLKGN